MEFPVIGAKAQTGNGYMSVLISGPILSAKNKEKLMLVAFP